MLQGPHEHADFERRLNIGRVHVRVGLPQRYVFTAMNVLRTTLGDMCDEQLDLESSTYARRSMSKIMEIELSLMLERVGFSEISVRLGMGTEPPDAVHDTELIFSARS